MDIQKIAIECVNILKSKYEVPSFGFLAGGSLGNLIWEKVSGNKAVINDIDIYQFNNKIALNEFDITKQRYIDKEPQLEYDDYSGQVHTHYRTKDFYIIDHTEIDGAINTIYYDSASECQDTILKSFDINCCQVGYDIISDKLYWTKEFENFLENGKLQVVNLGTPAHTAIRLVKKSHELNCKFDQIEMDMIEWCIKSSVNTKRFLDSDKVRFKERYANIYKKYELELDTRFILERDLELEEHLSSKGIDDKIWHLDVKNKTSIFDGDENINSTFRSVDFIFYVRNIFGDKNLENIWYNIHHLLNPGCSIIDYLDIEPTTDDLKILNNLTKVSAKCINNLRGLKISKQLNILRSLLSRYSDDPIIAISILENHSLSEADLVDDFTMLILELSVRKEILEDVGGKVDKLLGTTYTDHSYLYFSTHEKEHSTQLHLNIP